MLDLDAEGWEVAVMRFVRCSRGGLFLTRRFESGDGGWFFLDYLKGVWLDEG